MGRAERDSHRETETERERERERDRDRETERDRQSMDKVGACMIHGKVQCTKHCAQCQ